MNRILSMLFVLAVVSQGLLVANAEEKVHEAGAEKNVMQTEAANEDLCEDCWKEGAYTSENPVAGRIATLPLRAVTAVVGAPLGLVKGFAKGAAAGWKKTSDATFGSIKTEDSYAVGNVSSSFLKAPLLIPVGVLAMPFGVTVGATTGAVEGTARGTVSGFMYPDKL